MKDYKRPAGAFPQDQQGWQDYIEQYQSKYICPDCDGEGWVWSTLTGLQKEECPNCEGRGYLE